jgi:hypothetical protein
MSKRAANLIVISSHAEGSPAVHFAPQLACVNRKIAERVANSANAHVHAIFAEAAFLAERAMEAATELQRMPGMSAEAFAETLDFWRRVRDQSGTAALDSLGGNSTLAEALITFRLLHQPSDEAADNRCRLHAPAELSGQRGQ